MPLNFPMVLQSGTFLGSLGDGMLMPHTVVGNSIQPQEGKDAYKFEIHPVFQPLLEVHVRELVWHFHVELLHKSSSTSEARPRSHSNRRGPPHLRSLSLLTVQDVRISAACGLVPFHILKQDHNISVVK